MAEIALPLTHAPALRARGRDNFLRNHLFYGICQKKNFWVHQFRGRGRERERAVFFRHHHRRVFCPRNKEHLIYKWAEGACTDVTGLVLDELMIFFHLKWRHCACGRGYCFSIPHTLPSLCALQDMTVLCAATNTFDCKYSPDIRMFGEHFLRKIQRVLMVLLSTVFLNGLR